MNTRKIVTCAAAAAIAFGVTCAARGATPSPKRSTPAAQSGNAAAELQALQQAYALLSAADHDYHGHRIRAMHCIEVACKALGSDAKGDGAGNEAQATSDAQLRQAQAMVQSVHDTAASANQIRLVRILDRALKELSTALSIK